MKLDAIMRDVDHEIIQLGEDVFVKDITIDSRAVTEGTLFVCIRGLTVDRHRFIEDAAAKNAAVIVIDRDQDSYPDSVTICKVEDARRALSVIAANFHGRPAERLRLFGVTGTNGKTSTTCILESILQQVGSPGLIGTVGLRVGGRAVDIPFQTSTTPDPPELHQVFGHAYNSGARDIVMEVTSHALALYKVEGLHFEIAVFTNLTQDHLDFHGTMENYLAAKAKLFGQCRFGIVNIDDQYSPQIMTIGNPERWVTYGIENDCDVRAVHIETRAEGSAFDVEIDGVTENFYLPVKGRFNIYNALASIAAALTVGMNPAQIREGLAAFPGVPGRIQSVPNDKGLSVLVDYAHSPDGLVNIIGTVRAFTTGRVITLFGCGGDRDPAKRPIMGRIAGELSDYCILTSDNPRNEPPDEIVRQAEVGLKETNCPYDALVDRREAIFRGIELARPGDSFIITGKGHEDYQIIGGKTIHFDDFEVAKEALG